MTQDKALADYALRRDAEAFARIVNQYQRLIFATCRRQLHDRADIDDAVQETFLRLAQTAKEVHSNVGAWLHTCAVNVAIDINRRRSTRQRHELAAVEHRSKSEAPQVMLAELREHLDAALLKLDPEQRELIVQRFFVGRPQVDLATEACVSPSAISHRLDRAIEALRQHLSAMGCVIAATGGLIALLEGENASAAVPNSLTANVMKIGLSGVTANTAVGWSSAIPAVLTSTAAVLIIVVGLWIEHQRSHSRSAQTPSPSGMVVDQNPQGPSASTPQWQPAQPAKEFAVLAGRILDSDGKPVAGAAVELRGPIYQETASDAQGNYSFKKVTQSGEYQIAVTADGFVSIEPYRGGDPAIQLTNSSHAQRDVVLQRGVRIVVTVTNALGELVADANVEIDRAGVREDVKQSNTVGQVKFLVPVSNSPSLLWARANGYAPAHSTVTPGSLDKPLEVNFILDTGFTVAGIAMGSDNKPATGWKVVALPDWSSSNYMPEGFPIDARGNFTLKDIGSGTYTLMIDIGMMWRPVSTLTMPPQKLPVILNLPMPSLASQIKFAGRVHFVDDNGPVSAAGQVVYIRAMSLSGDRQSYEGSLQVTGDGKSQKGETSFDIGGIPPGAYRVTFESEAIETKVLDNLQWPTKLPPIELKFLGKPRLIGNVVDGASEKPIAQYALRLRKNETLGNGANYVPDGRWSQVSDPAGRFDIETAGPGVYQVQVSADGYAWIWSQEVRLEPGKGAPPVQIKLTPGGTLSGTVVDASGKPIQGAKVLPLSMAQAILGRPGQTEGEAGAARTDARGIFTLKHLAAGQETLKISDADFSPLTASNLKVIDGQETSAGTIKLPVGGNAEGTIFDAQGEPMADITVNFKDNEGYGLNENLGSIQTAVTDDRGHFHAEHLPHQVIWVRLNDEWNHHGVVRRTIFPIDGKTAHIDLGGPTPLRGRLLTAGKPVANKRITLGVDGAEFGPVIDLGQTDNDGRFIFYGPPPGRYTLFAEASGGIWISVETVIVGTEPIDLGDVLDDVGDVLITVKADDSADLAKIQFVGIEPTGPTGMEPPSYLAGPQKGATNLWLAENVPAGHLCALVEMKGTPQITYTATFDRIKAQSQTDVAVRLLSRSATLKISATPMPSGGSPQYVTLGNDAGSMTVGLVFPPLTNQLQLPPGNYHPLNTESIEHSAVIVVKDGQTTKAEIDPWTLYKSDMINLPINVWTADGVLVAGAKLHLVNANGIRIDPIEDFDQGQLFTVHPGHYRAVLDWPTQTPLIRDIDVPGPITARSPSVDLTE